MALAEPGNRGHHRRRGHITTTPVLVIRQP